MSRDLQSVLDAVLDGVVLIDRHGRIEDANTEACRILDTSVEAIRGESIGGLLDAGAAIEGLAQRVLETGKPFVQDEIAFERRGRPALMVDLSVSPLYASEGGTALDGAVVVVRDRTIPNSLREIVSQQEQLASYGWIAAGIAHEVKNPLGGIRGAAELLEGWSEQARAKRAASLIVREVDRISDLVEELMVFARGDELDLRAVNLHRVIDAVIELARMDPLSNGIQIERSYDPSIPEIEADPDRLQQVFLNLLRNALQALETRSGRVEFKTRMAIDQRLTGPDLESLPTVQVIISDTGDGISAEILDRLTTPFFTTRTKGTGLGLAVARHWINRHQGTLQIESPEGEGTKVRVNLPLKIAKGAVPVDSAPP